MENFDELPTPFRCVATELETGKAFVFRRGNLARALRATMAVPGIFTPVEWEGHILVDGGLVDNLPTDVARQMGADVVIAVHFATPVPPARQLQSLPNVLTQAVSVAISVTERDNLRNADLVLAPSLVGITGIDFKHAHELIERGYQAAAQKERFLATLALNDEDWAAYLAERRSRVKPVPPPATRLVARSSNAAVARHAQAEFDRSADSGLPLSLDQIEHELSTLVASAALPGAFYGLSAAQPATLNAELEPRTGSQFFIRPSLALAVADGDPTRGTLNGFAAWLPQNAFRASYRVHFAVGYSPQLTAEHDHPMGAGQWFWSPTIDLHRQDSSTYSVSLHLTHWQDTYSAAFDLGYGLGPRLRLRAGVAAGYENFSAIQFPGARPAGDGAYIAPRLLVDWNSLDDPSLPSRGTDAFGLDDGTLRRWDGRTVPLGQSSFEQHIPLLSGTVTASLHDASSFGVALNYFDLFHSEVPPIFAPSVISSFMPQAMRSVALPTANRLANSSSSASARSSAPGMKPLELCSHCNRGRARRAARSVCSSTRLSVSSPLPLAAPATDRRAAG